ncbi:MAG: MFS transporter, partial [Bacteroidales bacterium]|nr:MFS transporter [Bacteroidales bacterium]
MQRSNKKSPWTWIPTLYFVEGIPYFIVNTISLIMFKDMGMDNGTLALLTSLISLPWVVKPLWSPFVDIFRSKRWWIVTMQLIMLVAIGLIAATVRMSTFTLTLILFI